MTSALPFAPHELDRHPDGGRILATVAEADRGDLEGRVRAEVAERMGYDAMEQAESAEDLVLAADDAIAQIRLRIGRSAKGMPQWLEELVAGLEIARDRAAAAFEIDGAAARHEERP
jgi:hypothetical protein